MLAVVLSRSLRCVHPTSRRPTLRTVTLDMIQTVALAAVLLFVGYGVRRRIGVLDRFNIPAPVVGGFLFAALALGLRQMGILAFEFNIGAHGAYRF